MVTDLQKAGLWKRISAGLFDFVVLVMVAVGIATALSWVLKVDTYNQAYTAALNQYQAQYGVQFDITSEAYEALTDQEKEAYNAAYQAFAADETVLYNYNMIMNLALLTATFSILITVVLLILPYLLFDATMYIPALLCMLLIIVAIIAAFTYYTSVAQDQPFRPRFLEMAGISIGVAVLSFIVGLLAKHFLGVEV